MIPEGGHTGPPLQNHRTSTASAGLFQRSQDGGISVGVSVCKKERRNGGVFNRRVRVSASGALDELHEGSMIVVQGRHVLLMAADAFALPVFRAALHLPDPVEYQSKTDVLPGQADYREQ